ncbi:hypothetical protein [Nitrosococcus oceani]|uniref:hypothetical protein n=1 Tax=Nitrosococcus oceani TaxID=1229 RepID=UPI001E288E96|nr:hypothetical protein [Nitrosococcus oceani]
MSVLSTRTALRTSMPLRALWSVSVLVAIIVLVSVVSTTSSSGYFFLWTGYIVTLVAIMVAWRRGGIYSPYYWFVLAAAYPLLSPFLIQNLLGFPYFSYFARDMQDAQALGVPILVGALASLFLALTIHETGHGSRLAIEANKGCPRIGKKSAFLLIVLSAPLILFLAWLSEPGQIVGLADYQTLREQRIGGVRFAGGAWLLFEIVALSGYLRLRNEKGAFKRLGSYIF